LINDEYQFVGLSAKGKGFPLSIALDRPYLPSIKTNQNAALFFMRGYGSPRKSSAFALWHTELKTNAKPVQLDGDVLDFQILKNGLGIYRSRHFGVKKGSEEAFCYSPTTIEKHNLLDGIERLKPLTPDLAELSYVVDTQKIQLIAPECFTTAPPCALCIFDHLQADGRAFALAPGADANVPRIKRRRWRTGIYLNPDAVRFHLKEVPDVVFDSGARWINSSGNVFIGRNVWIGEGKTAKRELRLSSYQLQFGN